MYAIIPLKEYLYFELTRMDEYRFAVILKRRNVNYWLTIHARFLHCLTLPFA